MQEERLKFEVLAGDPEDSVNQLDTTWAPEGNKMIQEFILRFEALTGMVPPAMAVFLNERKIDEWFAPPRVLEHASGFYAEMDCGPISVDESLNEVTLTLKFLGVGEYSLPIKLVERPPKSTPTDQRPNPPRDLPRRDVGLRKRR
jgi:hypothetical protein